jgi:hypothetical protein
MNLNLTKGRIFILFQVGILYLTTNMPLAIAYYWKNGMHSLVWAFIVPSGYACATLGLTRLYCYFNNNASWIHLRSKIMGLHYLGYTIAIGMILCMPIIWQVEK